MRPASSEDCCVSIRGQYGQEHLPPQQAYARGMTASPSNVHRSQFSWCPIPSSLLSTTAPPPRPSLNNARRTVYPPQSISFASTSSVKHLTRAMSVRIWFSTATANCVVLCFGFVAVGSRIKEAAIASSAASWCSIADSCSNARCRPPPPPPHNLGRNTTHDPTTNIHKQLRNFMIDSGGMEPHFEIQSMAQVFLFARTTPVSTLTNRVFPWSGRVCVSPGAGYERLWDGVPFQIQIHCVSVICFLRRPPVPIVTFRVLSWSDHVFVFSEWGEYERSWMWEPNSKSTKSVNVFCVCGGRPCPS